LVRSTCGRQVRQRPVRHLRLEEVGWTLLGEADVRGDWNGLTDATNALWERAGRPDIYSDWRRALSSVP
jgi:hypothetical protein